MPKKVFTPAQIVDKLRQIERLLASGKAASVVYKRAGVTEQVYRRWRKQYGGLAKRLKGLEQALKARDLDLTESLDQQTATAEILRVISSSPTDVMPVLEAVTRRAAQLCDAPDSRLYLLEGDEVRYVTGFGEMLGAPQNMPLTRGIVVARVIMDSSVVHIDDLGAALDEFPEARVPQQKYGVRTILAVPLMRENQAFGAILMRRKEVRPFTEKQVALVKTFADQAVIAIENVRLFKELQVRNADLTETLAQQTATSEILRVISRSPTNLQPVFDVIADSSRRLCLGLYSAVCLVEGDMVHLVAHMGVARAIQTHRHSVRTDGQSQNRIDARYQDSAVDPYARDKVIE